MKNAFFYRKHKSFVKFLKKQGLKENQNICDYWFDNRDKLLKKLYKKFPMYAYGNQCLEEIETRIRWESELGKLFVKEIRVYLDSEQKRLRKLPTREDPFKGFFEEVDLSKVSLTYKGELINISKFCERFNNDSNIGGQIDLRGIPLNEFRVDNITLSNLCFDYSDFSNSHIQQCKLNNINFTNCDFTNSHVSLVRINKYTNFNESNFKNSYVDISFETEINNEKNGIGSTIYYNKISYCQLIKILFRKIFKIRKVARDKKYTEFCTIEVGICPNDIELSNYLLWYSGVLKRFGRIKENNIFQNIVLVMEVLLTKYWRSYFSLLIFSSSIIIFFANIFHKTNINEEVISFFNAFHYSFVCFTGLGTSEILPKTDLMKILSMSESILGYVILAMLIYLFSKRLEHKY